MAEAVAKSESEHVSKKLKKAEVCSDAVDSTTEHLFSTFQDFHVDRVLNCSQGKKFVAVVGQLKGRDGRAVVLVEKQSFNEDKLSELLGKDTRLEPREQQEPEDPELAGMVYHRTALVPPSHNAAKVTIVYPAQDKHIAKYEKQTFSVVNETPELYEKVTKKFIEKAAFGKEWIYNILEHKKEKDRIVFEDRDPDLGFVLLPDLKWTGKQMDDLYLQAIVMRRDLASIRDLTAQHLPLLRNVYDKGTAAIKARYGVGPEQLRIYLHYHPSFYHLHVHFTSVNFEAPGSRIGKAHMLADVMSVLEQCGDHYQRAVLSVIVKDNHPLRTSYAQEGYFDE